MPALNYKPRFVDAVKSGFKAHTIRAWRKRPFLAGGTLMHYTGMRTKACIKIRPDTVCIAATAITIDSVQRTVSLAADSCYYRAGPFNLEALVALALSDGFASIGDFFLFFGLNHGDRFTGQLVEWRP